MYTGSGYRSNFTKGEAIDPLKLLLVPSLPGVLSLDTYEILKPLTNKKVIITLLIGAHLTKSLPFELYVVCFKRAFEDQIN